MASSNWYGISQTRAAKIRAEVKAEVKQQLQRELEPDIRKRVEKELEPVIRERAEKRLETIIRERVEKNLREKCLAKAREEVRQETARLVPSENLREGFLEFVRETEIDSHSQAMVASDSADRLERKATWLKRLTAPLPWVAFLGALGALYGVFERVGGYQTVEFIGASVGLLAVFVGTLWLALRYWREPPEVRKLRRISSDYLILAERSKSFRLVHAENLDTKGRVTELTEQLRREKVRLDDEFHPRIGEVEEARVSVRQRIAVEEFDPEEDFDDRLSKAGDQLVRQAKA